MPSPWAETHYWIPEADELARDGVKTTCNGDCLEACNQGTCEGFKVYVAGDGSEGYVGLANAGFTNTQCTSGGGWEGSENYPTTVWWCGSPVWPVTITVGGNTTTIRAEDKEDGSGYGRWYQYPDGHGYWQMHTCCSGAQFCCSIDPIVPMTFSATDAHGNAIAYPGAGPWPPRKGDQ